MSPSAVHRLRGLEGRGAYEFDFSIGNATIVFYWRASASAWQPMTGWGHLLPAVEIARRTGLDEVQAAAKIEASAAVCEREYLHRAQPRLHLAA